MLAVHQSGRSGRGRERGDRCAVTRLRGEARAVFGTERSGRLHRQAPKTVIHQGRRQAHQRGLQPVSRRSGYLNLF